MSETDDVIYILTNDAMPGYVKIGKTQNLEQRVRDLSASTSVPIPFTVFYAARVMDSSFVERQLHDAFDDSRINPRREFFEVAPERVVAALRLAELENVTPKQDFVDSQDDQEALDGARKRRSVFNFKMVDIPMGSEIYFSRDESVKAIVVDNRHIEFKGLLTSLSTTAQALLGVDYNVAGTDYWMFDDETLDERRRRYETSE